MSESRSQRLTISAVWDFVLRNVNIGLLVVILVVGGLITPRFLTFSNLINILRQISINGILVIGFTIVYISNGFDLSMGAVMSLCCCLVVNIQNNGVLWYWTIPIVLLIGIALGLFNGIMMKITRGESGETFLITLCASMIVLSFSFMYTGGRRYFGVQESFKYIGQGSVGPIPFAFLLMMTLLVLAQVFMKKTKLGREIYLVGANKIASFCAGINVSWVRTFAFIIAGVSSALAAVVMCSRSTAANFNCAYGYEFDATIACIIGGNSMGSGKGGMWESLLGVFILGFITNLGNLMGLSGAPQNVIKGIVLVVALLVDRYRRKTQNL